ncbi:MAG TPA: endonuclease/exonuclease/phosphatase family protein [Ignavibacteriales bacterium]|nr:endonuclease/exonuclease/phosphatase family protein [Ignavibacteriales bacterium]
MKQIAICSFLIIFFVSALNGGALGDKNPDKKYFYAASWNLENLFDAEDDPKIDDAEFLAGSPKNWTDERVTKKLEKLSRVIIAMNDGKGPDVLAVQEVENYKILNRLVAGYLKNKNYKIIHTDSPDERGIDVALVYNADLFKPISNKAIQIELADRHPTRNILEASFKLGKKDTVIFYVNHWPSRRGGEETSEPDRKAAAKILRAAVDKAPLKNIIILGDFNDEPLNNSISITLNAKPASTDAKYVKADSLYNLAYWFDVQNIGSYFYKGSYNMLDQIIISGRLARESNNNISYICGSFGIFKPEFMLTFDGYYKGSPHPTFGGAKYIGGYSDHFPVYAKFNYLEK